MKETGQLPPVGGRVKANKLEFIPLPSSIIVLLHLKINVTLVPGHLDTSMHQPEVGTLVLHADLPIFTREKEECWMGRGKLVLVHTSSQAHGSSLHTPLPSTRAHPHLRLTQFWSKRHWSRSCTCPLNAALISFTQHPSGSLNHPRLVS